MYHAQVVQTAGRDELIMQPHRAGGDGVVEVEVEVQDIFPLRAQFLSNQVEQDVGLLHLVCDVTQDGQHIFLLAQLHAVVHLTVEVDGQIGNHQNGATDVQQTGLGLQRIR